MPPFCSHACMRVTCHHHAHEPPRSVPWTPPCHVCTGVLPRAPNLQLWARAGGLQVDEVIGNVAERFGKVDGVANCVGSIVLKPAHQTSEAEFDQVGATARMRLSGPGRGAGGGP